MIMWGDVGLTVHMVLRTWSQPALGQSLFRSDPTCRLENEP